jgi:hypothetical protein
MKKLTYITITIFIFISLASFGQRDSEFGQKKDKTFEKNNFGKNSGPAKAGPPNPGGGGTGGGNPVPISGGFLLLSGGLVIYTLARKKNLKKDA